MSEWMGGLFLTNHDHPPLLCELPWCNWNFLARIQHICTEKPTPIRVTSDPLHSAEDSAESIPHSLNM